MAIATQNITTAEQLWKAGDIGRCELVRGELIMMSPANADHGGISNDLAYFVTDFVRKHQLGRVFAAETGFLIQTSPDTVRAPDVAFIAKVRTPGISKTGFCDVVPDLVAEVVSPSDRHSEVMDKVDQWLDAGVRLVWVIDPPSRTVTVFHPDKSSRKVACGDSLTGEDVLPGFALPIAKLFE